MDSSTDKHKLVLSDSQRARERMEGRDKTERAIVRQTIPKDKA